MKRRNEKKMISAIKRLLLGARVLDNRISTPTLEVRDYILVDFRIRYLNKEIIFEYNGIHHYAPFSYHNTSLQESNQKFKEQKLRDQWLREYCRKKNIILIELDGRFIQGDNIKIYLTMLFKKLGLI